MVKLTESSKWNRRQVAAGGVHAAAGVLLIPPRTAFGFQANSTIEAGIVGAGGRGNWIAPLFAEYGGTRIVALADVVKAHLEATRQRLSVDPSRAYYGPQAFEELSQSKLDAVIIQTPPYFHPEQAQAAVEAGKHVFVAKPVAVDVPGSKSILATGQLAARKGLSFWVDFQTRAMPEYQECERRIRRGDIGKPVMAQVFYYAGRPFKDKGTPGMDPGQRRVANFYMDRALGGDIIVEQNIHVIDTANWLLGAHPERAYGSGGRTDWSGTPYDAGDAYDHFLVQYVYPDNVHADFSSHQLTRAFSDLCVRVFGIGGCADTHYGGSLRILGANPWTGTEKGDTFRQGAIHNIQKFAASIREGNPVNNAGQAVEANLTAILGRMAAYGNRTVTWQEMLRSEERFEERLALRW